MAKTKLKTGARLLIIFGSIIAFIGIALLGAIAYFRLPVSAYYGASQKAFVIPGLNDDFVPQGFCYDGDTDSFIISGYYSDDAASPLYQVNKTTGELVKCVKLAKTDGHPFTGHSGGVAVNGDYIYVAGSKCVYVYSYYDFIKAADGDVIICLGKVSTKVSDDDYVGTSFLSVVGDTLIVGEFYDLPKYPTLESHHVATADGVNHALMVVFNLSDSCSFGIDPTPVVAYSVTDQVQGMTVENGKMYLSCSYGATFSRIYEHDLSSLTPNGEITVMGDRIPLYILDGSNLVKEYKAPPMSEEIVVMGDTLYIMCESASNKYIFGKLTGGKWCYATNLSTLRSK